MQTCVDLVPSYLSQLADFNLPHLYLASQLGVNPFEFCRISLQLANTSRWAIVWHCLHDPSTL